MYGHYRRRRGAAAAALAARPAAATMMAGRRRRHRPHALLPALVGLAMMSVLLPASRYGAVRAEAAPDDGADAAATPAAAEHQLPNFKKMRVKELKKLLKERGVECKGCGEKAHLVQRAKETYHMPVLPAAEEPPPPAPDLSDLDLSNMNIPGMDPEKMKQMMAEMKGDFSHIKDPRRRKALAKLKKSGMQISGVSGMDIDQLENLANVMGSAGGFGGAGGGAAPKPEL